MYKIFKGPQYSSKEQRNKIVGVLTDPKNIQNIEEEFGKEFVASRLKKSSDVLRLAFDPAVSHGYTQEEMAKINHYNDSIVHLFQSDPNFADGIDRGYKGGYPISTQCWKGSMYIYCVGKVIAGLEGYGTKSVIGRILGYNDIGKVIE